MFDDLFDKHIEYEVIQPGIILGAIDLICRACGEVSVHEPNSDGSCRYLCPVCGAEEEL